MRVSQWLPLLTLAIGLSGCDRMQLEMPQSAQAAEIAVLDLLAVAKALGRDDDFKKQLESAGKQLGEQLTQVSTVLQTQLREEQAKLGENPTDEERGKLRQMAVDAQRKIQQSQLQARQKARQFQLQLATRFRQDVQPVAAEIARAKGASVIMLANSLMWFEPAIDITADVIGKMRSMDNSQPAVSDADGSKKTTE